MRRKVNNVIQGLQVSAAGMKAQMDCQDIIANNLANVSTPGFKRSSVSFASFSTQFEQAVRNPMTPMPPHAPYALPTLVVQQDVRPGMAQDTGAPTNLARRRDRLVRRADSGRRAAHPMRRLRA